MARRRQRSLTLLLLALLMIATTATSHPITTTHRNDFTGLFQLTNDDSRHGLALTFHLRELPEERFWLYMFSHHNLNITCAIHSQQLKLIDNISLETQQVTNKTVSCNEYRVCTLFFSNVSDGFYCAQKLERPHTLYTATVHVTDPIESVVVVPTVLVSSKDNLPIVAWLIGASVLLLAVVIAGWYYFRMRNRLASTAPEPVLTPSIGPQTPLLTPSKVKLFVVYVNDNQRHLDMVTILVNLFRSLFGWDVVVDWECKEEISTLGPSVWVNNTLRNCTKILFISSEKAHRMIQTLTNRTQVSNDHKQLSETVFLFAWRIISSNTQLCDKYDKIYNVRFRSTNVRFFTPIIVRGRHFVIPTHLTQLAYQLITSDQEKDPSLEKELESIIKSSPYYSRLITAVLPIHNEAIENGNDTTWISPGF